MHLYEESLVSNSLTTTSNHQKTFAFHFIARFFKNHCFPNVFRHARYNPSPLTVIIAMPDPTAHERRLETSYTVQLGSFVKIE